MSPAAQSQPTEHPGRRAEGRPQQNPDTTWALHHLTPRLIVRKPSDSPADFQQYALNKCHVTILALRPRSPDAMQRRALYRRLRKQPRPPMEGCTQHTT